MYIIMLGAPGSGKGTIGKRLSKDFNLPHVSTGDIFRENLKKQTELGKKVEKYMAAGELVPDDIVMEMIKARLLEDDVKEGAILDGFARTEVQAIEIDKFLSETRAEQKRIAIELDVPDSEIIRRIVNRISCSNKGCGEIYNLQSRPPKQAGICDICGSALTKRDDDNEETARNRLAIYHANSKELLEFYAKNKELYTIRPEGFEDAVKEIEEHLKNI